MSTTLHIKNMVCARCIEAVEEEFSRLKIPIQHIQLGGVTLEKQPDSQALEKIRVAMRSRGFELLEDKNARIVEQIKTLIIESIHRSTAPIKINFSIYLEKEIGRDYSFLSALFSSVEGVTIERYNILQKTERIKELLIYDELNLGEIAAKMGYSSVQYLSSQFKKVTGMTPGDFRKIRPSLRNPLDNV